MKGRNDMKAETEYLLTKYFSTIKANNELAIIKIQLRIHVKILDAERKKKIVLQCLKEKFEYLRKT